MPSKFKIHNSVQNLQLDFTTNLPPGTYDELSRVVKPLSFTEYLSVDRMEGITDGSTYVHTTTFYLGPAQFQIIVTIKGTAITSDMTVQLVVNNLGAIVQTPPATDVGTFNLSGPVTLTAFNTLPLSFTGGFERFLGTLASFDDVDLFFKPL